MSTASMTELRDALAFTTAVKRAAVTPWAAPLRSINQAASYFAEDFLNIERDGPRRLDEGSRPYWATLPRPVVRPIVSAVAARYPNVRGVQAIAQIAQYGTDAFVGACALVLCVVHVARLQGGYAGVMLSAHAQHVVRLFVGAAPLLAIVLI